MIQSTQEHLARQRELLVESPLDCGKYATNPPHSPVKTLLHSKTAAVLRSVLSVPRKRQCLLIMSIRIRGLKAELAPNPFEQVIAYFVSDNLVANLFELFG